MKEPQDDVVEQVTDILDRRVVPRARPGRSEGQREHADQKLYRARKRRRHRHNRHLVDALSRGQRVVLASLIAAWAAWVAWGWAWWLKPEHITSPIATAANTVLLGIEMIVLPIWFYFWLWRMKRADRRLPLPDLRVAMVVTKAPSEPWPLVRETLEAMIAQAYPAPYDVWLADERPAAETRAWCADHGVRLSSREGREDYHRPDWPRRTKCKEGNLAFFYDHWGYEQYDVVSQLDADHIPEPDYLRRMVTPFLDPDVGYVAAPSICDRNAQDSWAARGRLYAEATLHGPMQAGHSGGFAPSCIGSHYAVRTSALKEIGGIGPELAEDFTTTLMMSSHGWQGVFAVDAEAHGHGPDTVADGMTQEFRWSRSMMNVLLSIGQKYWTGLSLRAKLRLGFCQLWYPMFGLLMLASVVIPIVAVATRTPFARVGLGQFYLHFGPAVLILLLTVLWLRRLSWLRPRTARALSWEAVRFQIVRWPWALLGCVAAVAGHVTGREVVFAVTPKGRTGVNALPLKLLAAPLALMAAAASPVVLGLDGGPAHGYRTLTLINVGLYLGAAVALVALHVVEHPPKLKLPALRRSATGIGLITTVACLLVAAQTGRTALVSSAAPPPPPSPPAGAGAGAGRTPALGVTTKSLANNSFRRWRPGDLSEVDAFERDAGAHQDIVMWFADWQHGRFDATQLRAVAARGSTPEISWEPWDYEVGLRRPQPRYTLRSITRGRHDAYIRSWARGLRGYGGPVLLRLGQEMNGNWYPWSEQANGNRRGDYVAAWRHVHDLFAREGVRNVRWVWSPVARELDASEYPGDAYVDVVGITGFNGGSALNWTGWRGFASIFDTYLDRLRTIAPGKPQQISEVGSAERGGDKARWIRGMFADLQRRPEVRSVIWFDVAKQADWRVSSSKAAIRAYAAGAAARPPARP